jgi:hypothetical protein
VLLQHLERSSSQHFHMLCIHPLLLHTRKVTTQSSSAAAAAVWCVCNTARCLCVLLLLLLLLWQLWPGC